MRLTTQMVKEHYWMSRRIEAIYNEALSDYPITSELTSGNYQRYQRTLKVYREEINAHKAKLEIFFSDTDIKE